MMELSRADVPVSTKDGRLGKGLLNLGSDRAIGQQHELLDETVRLEGFLLLDVDGIRRLWALQVDWGRVGQQDVRLCARAKGDWETNS